VFSNTDGGFTAGLAAFDYFGNAMTGVGDLNGDGVVDLAVSAYFTSFGAGSSQGVVYLLLLQKDGTVLSHSTLQPGTDALDPVENSTYFGSAVVTFSGHIGVSAYNVERLHVIELLCSSTGAAFTLCLRVPPNTNVIPKQQSRFRSGSVRLWSAHRNGCNCCC